MQNLKSLDSIINYIKWVSNGDHKLSFGMHTLVELSVASKPINVTTLKVTLYQNSTKLAIYVLSMDPETATYRHIVVRSFVCILDIPELESFNSTKYLRDYKHQQYIRPAMIGEGCIMSIDCDTSPIRTTLTMLKHLHKHLIAQFTDKFRTAVEDI